MHFKCELQVFMVLFL